MNDPPVAADLFRRDPTRFRCFIASRVGLTAAYGINKLLHVPLNTSIIFKYGGTHTVFVADNEA